ncbi:MULTISPECIES: response regulator transcription factor [Amycolatopsis]|uniref:response regulator transcription factor n=1 Tax=Amycolatopsis TaxID=1813 RepID=UPI0010700ED0|nr:MULTISPECIES: response regulator transcription factor [Amycolatopsis]MCG3749020.1 response regulator transcription factor [Amycolatopsis sp. Poz14]
MPRAEEVASIRDERELVERAGHLLAGADEFACAANDLHTWSAMQKFAQELPKERKLRVRKVYLSRVMLDPAGAEHLRMLQRLGAEVRISDHEINETILLDGRVAILAAGPGYNVVTAPDLVRGISSLFEAAWRSSTAMEAYETRFAELRQYTPQLLDLLSSGSTDEKAARAMGVGLRTYRRRVAELMDVLGATSRFQAGALAREAGLL